MNEWDYVIDGKDESGVTVVGQEPTGWEMVVFELEDDASSDARYS